MASKDYPLTETTTLALDRHKRPIAAYFSFHYSEDAVKIFDNPRVRTNTYVVVLDSHSSILRRNAGSLTNMKILRCFIISIINRSRPNVQIPVIRRMQNVSI